MNLKIALLAATAAILPYYALAQTAASTPAEGAAAPGTAPATSASTATQLPTVVVTARKRSEKLLSVPISITTLSNKDLQKRQVHSIQDLASQTAGFSVDNTVSTSGRADRSFPNYVIRGILPSLSTNPTTTIFLDGSPLIGGEVDDLENLQQVDVLKGPQSVYFGRETFAGAVSLTTRSPSQVPTVTLDGLIGDRNYYDERGTIEGPLIPGKLSVLGSFRYYSRDGSYNNNAVADKTSQKLGDQSTKSGNLEFLLTPTPDLIVKVLGLYWHDDDGPSAQELILPSQSDCQFPATAAQPATVPWFCGQVPNRLSGQPAANDLVTPAIQRLLTYLGTPAGDQVFKPLKNNYGLARDAYHGSANVDYYLENYGITLTSQTAVDLNKFSELQDLANDDGSQTPNFAYPEEPFANPYYDFPFFVEQEYRSFSQELRFTSDSNQRLRYVGGLNYEYTRVDESIGGGNGFDFVEKYAPVTSSTISGFGGLDYDVLPKVTVSLGGRFQSDHENTSPVGGLAHVSATFDDFLPSVSIKYKFTPQLMTYFTYSKGVNPGTFNGTILSLPASEQAVLASLGAQVVVKPERLTNYELGVKGSFFNNTLDLSTDAYYDVWTDQINIADLDFLVNNHVENTSADLNNGKINLPGVEADADWLPIRQLELNASGAINDSSIVQGGCVTCQEEIGTNDVKGKKLPDVSEFQLSLGAEWTDRMNFLEGTPLTRLADWDYYGRGDYTFKSSSYENSDDLVYTPSENLLNLRAGITHGNLTIEAFVDNVTNWGGPTALAGITDLGSTAETFEFTDDSLVGGLPDLRTFGVRLHYKFGV